MVYLWATLLLLSNVIAWGSNFFSLPGNWLLLFFAVVYKIVLPVGMHPSLSWSLILLAFLMALLGEAWEFAASAAGAARRGGSRRGAIYSIGGSLVGSLAGALAGAPFVPVAGPMIGAIVGGALGAFGGAYFGERHRSHDDRVAIGKAAMVGRLFGTAGKLAFGLIMLVIITADSFSDF